MEYESEGRELERLFIAWRKLPEKTKGAILVLAGVRETPGPGPQTLRHVKKGETPDWLVTALNWLKDSRGYVSDRELARRLRVSPSTLSRHAGYQRAKRTYLQPTRRVVRRAQRKG